MARDGSKRDGQAIPGVDGRHHEREIHNFFFVEIFSDFSVDGIRDVRLGNQCDGFGPSQRCALFGGIEGRFAPGIKFVKALLGFAESASVL